MRQAGRPRLRGRGGRSGGGGGNGSPAPPRGPPTLAAAAAARLDAIRRDGLYRTLRGGAARGSRIVVGGRSLINLASNDYLGMAGMPAAAAAAASSAGRDPSPPSRGARAPAAAAAAAGSCRQLGSPGSRLASGGDESHAALEAALAGHRSAGAALAYPTGYMANIGAVQCLAEPGDTILSDSLNHASIIDACRLSGARTVVYEHNDMGALRAALAPAARRRPRGRVFVLTEGVFSMDGDTAPLPEICELASSRGAFVVLDDAHGDFVMGAGGRGTADELGVQSMIDVHTSSLSKGLGSFGGYVAAAADVVDLLVNASRAFVYTSALPAAVALHAASRLNAAGYRERRRRRLLSNVRRLGEGLLGAGFGLGAGGLRGGRGRGRGAAPRTTHIMPVMVGSERTAVRLGRELETAGVFALPVRYPTVARGAARIRISVSALLTAADIDYAVSAFAAAGRRLGLL